MAEKLLDDFDRYITQQRYVNRSEAVRDLIRSALVSTEWQDDKPVMGVISLVYDHHKPKLQERITEVQHGYHHQVISSTHVHMDHDNCLEVIIVHGKAAAILELSNNMKSLRGVRNCKLAMTTTGRDIH